MTKRKKRLLFQPSSIGRVLSTLTPSRIDRKDLLRAVRVVVAQMVQSSGKNGMPVDTFPPLPSRRHTRSPPPGGDNKLSLGCIRASVIWTILVQLRARADVVLQTQ